MDILFSRETHIIVDDIHIDTIVSGTLALDELLSSKGLELGAYVSNRFEVEVYNVDDLTGKHIYVYQIENDTEVPIFTGIIDSCKSDRSGDSRKIVAYDDLYSQRYTNIADWWTDLWKGGPSELIRNEIFTGSTPKVTTSSYFRDEDFAGWKAFDGNSADIYSCQNSWLAEVWDNKPWICYEFDNPLYLRKLTLSVCNNSNDYTKDFILQGSLDGVVFEDIETLNVHFPTLEMSTTEYQFDMLDKAYVYFRIYSDSPNFINLGDTACAFSEIQFEGYSSLERITKSLRDIRCSLLDYVGINYDHTLGLLNDDLMLYNTANMTSMPFYKMLQMVCELSCVIPNMNRYGILDFITIDSSTSQHQLSYNDKFGTEVCLFEGENSTFEEYTVAPISGVQIYNSTGNIQTTIGTTDNPYNISSNLLLYNHSDEELETIGTAIYDAIRNIQYRPSTIAMIVSDLNIKLGDCVETLEGGKSVVFAQSYFGPQLVEQTIISSGDEYFNETSDEVGIEFQVLNDAVYELGKTVTKVEEEVATYSSSIERLERSIVLKVAVDSEGKQRIVEVQLNADAETGTEYKVSADNISFIANNILELAANKIAINSDKFKVTEDGDLSANSGYFGSSAEVGWNIGDKSIYNGLTSPYAEDEAGMYVGVDAIQSAHKSSDTNFRYATLSGGNISVRDETETDRSDTLLVGSYIALTKYDKKNREYRSSEFAIDSFSLQNRGTTGADNHTHIRTPYTSGNIDLTLPSTSGTLALQETGGYHIPTTITLTQNIWSGKSICEPLFTALTDAVPVYYAGPVSATVTLAGSWFFFQGHLSSTNLTGNLLAINILVGQYQVYYNKAVSPAQSYFAKMFGFGSQLNNNTNLNSIVYAGTYYMSFSNTYINAPEDAVSVRGFLNVLNIGDTIKQIVYQCNGDNTTTTYPYVYIRQSTTSGVNWTNWMRLVVADDLWFKKGDTLKMTTFSSMYSGLITNSSGTVYVTMPLPKRVPSGVNVSVSFSGATIRSHQGYLESTSSFTIHPDTYTGTGVKICTARVLDGRQMLRLDITKRATPTAFVLAGTSTTAMNNVPVNVLGAPTITFS